MESVSRFIEKKLRLEVNREKSAVGVSGGVKMM
jgi:NH3-dependent NAD+ synthetase